MARSGATRVVVGMPTLVLLVTLAGAGAVSFVRVNVGIANVREGPSTKTSILGRAYEHDPLQVLTRRGAWLKVRDFEGYVGWVHVSLTDPGRAVIVTASRANIRSGPGTSHPVISAAEYGLAFPVVRDAGRWVEVELGDGSRGWVHESLVWGAD